MSCIASSTRRTQQCRNCPVRSGAEWRSKPEHQLETMQKSVALAALAATLVVPSSGTPSTRVFAGVRMADSVERMRVLWLAAHPDAADTNIIAWLARGRGVRRPCVWLTRGE